MQRETKFSSKFQYNIKNIIDSEYTGLTYVCVKNVSFTSICASTLIYVTS